MKASMATKSSKGMSKVHTLKQKTTTTKKTQLTKTVKRTNHTRAKPHTPQQQPQQQSRDSATISSATSSFLSQHFTQQSSQQQNSTTTSTSTTSTRTFTTSPATKLKQKNVLKSPGEALSTTTSAAPSIEGYAPSRQFTTKISNIAKKKTTQSTSTTLSEKLSATQSAEFASQNTQHGLFTAQQQQEKTKKTRQLWSQQQRKFRSTRPAREVKRDYYEVLGIPRDSDEAAIKKAYFALAKKYHPDMSKEPDAQKKFAEVSVAYECLSNAEKRRQYDQFGHDAEQFEQAGYGPGPGFNPEDILREMFFGGGMGGMGGGFGGFDFDLGGGHAQASRPRKGTDVQVEVKISFMEAVNGAEKSVNVKSLQPCEPCKGKGDKPGAKVETCRKCNGSGTQRLMKGMFQIESVCQPCGGKGQTTPTCNTCNGETLVEKTDRVVVRIPAGVDSSTNLRLVNQGDAGYKNGPRGHLWVKLNITPDPRFRREGSDVHVTVPLPLPTSVLGGIIDVPTLNGDVRLKIPPATSQRDTQIMRNSGIKVLNRDQRGHQYVHFDIQVPKNISPKARSLMEEFARETGARDFNTTSTGTAAPDAKDSGFGSFFGKKH